MTKNQPFYTQREDINSKRDMILNQKHSFDDRRATEEINHLKSRNKFNQITKLDARTIDSSAKPSALTSPQVEPADSNHINI